MVAVKLEYSHSIQRLLLKRYWLEVSMHRDRASFLGVLAVYEMDRGRRLYYRHVGYDSSVH